MVLICNTVRIEISMGRCRPYGLLLIGRGDHILGALVLLCGRFLDVTLSRSGQAHLILVVFQLFLDALESRIII